MPMTIRLDRRSRRFADVVPVDADEWCDTTLPLLLDLNGTLVAEAVERLDLRPITIDVEGRRFGLVRRAGAVIAGLAADADALVVEIDEPGFSDWVNGVRNVGSMIVSGDLRYRGGSIWSLHAWELVLRALTEGTAVHAPGAVKFHDRHGGPLDLHRIFGPDDDPQDVGHFVREAGYLHLRGWLDPLVMDAISADMDLAVSDYRPDDGRSWWATLDSGDEVCVRMRYFVEHSEATAELLASETWDRIRRAIAGDEDLVRAPVEGNIIEALFKPIGVEKGISDIPWHRDCAFGGHPFKCSGVTVGISVTGGDAETGMLRVVAGSHRAVTLDDPAWRHNDLPVIPLPTQTGDVTVHVSCTSHEALPPTSRGRKVMYTGFGLPDNGDLPVVPSGRQRDLRNEAYKLTSQPANTTRR